VAGGSAVVGTPACVQVTAAAAGLDTRRFAHSVTVYLCILRRRVAASRRGVVVVHYDEEQTIRVTIYLISIVSSPTSILSSYGHLPTIDGVFMFHIDAVVCRSSPYRCRQTEVCPLAIGERVG